jgi:hypothetical protein
LPTKGFQAINDMRLDGSLLRMVGSTVDADGQTGNDIFHLISSASLTNINHTCDTVQESVSIISPVVYTYTWQGTATSFLPLYMSVDTGSTNFAITQFCGDVINAITNVKARETTFDVYPNPATDEITVSSVAPLLSLTIRNMFGQAVREISINSKQHIIKIEDLPSGVYFITTFDQSRKFIKL